MSDEPLDALEAVLGEPVTVTLKAGSTYHGTLSSYDQHMNLVLDAPDEEMGPGIETVDNTTVIRGDNVVSIQR
jgi:small nuclear ribonucleoprotein